MKFLQGFLAVLAVAIGMIWAAFNVVVHVIANFAMLAFGIVILAIDLFALLVWFVNWRYYPE